MKFGRLTIVKELGRDERSRAYVLCRCDCGNVKKIRKDGVLSGHSKSCGCVSGKFKQTHGLSRSVVYRRWLGIKNRCRNKKDKKYPIYGGRGIDICERWEKFENFYEDMGDPPNGKHIDRIDNNNGYYKENCRWVTLAENNRNKRNNVKIKFNGKLITASEYSREIGVHPKTAVRRIKKMIHNF